MVPIISNVNVARGIDGYASEIEANWIQVAEIELAILCAFNAPHQQELAILIKFLDAVVSTVHNIEIVISINGQARWMIQRIRIALYFRGQFDRAEIARSTCWDR